MSSAGRSLRAASGLLADAARLVPGPAWAWALGAVATAYVSGLATGAAAEPFLVGRRRLRPDPLAREPIGRLPGVGFLVETEDGVRLQGEQAGPDGDVAVVLVHGYTQDMGCWHFQRRDLDEEVRVVLFDQRGHGRSGYGDSSRATIGQLARDLRAVLDSAVPSGPVVLVGHSLGGMAVMALAEAAPELLGDRVVGTVLVATTAGELQTLTFGLPSAIISAMRRAAPVALPVAKEKAELVTHGRALVGDIAYLATRRLSFGRRSVSPTLVEMVERASANVPLEVTADFYDTFTEHDTSAALPLLGRVPTTVVCAGRDRVVPPEHVRALAAGIPGARLVVAPHAGHMVLLEDPDVVTEAVRDVVRQVRGR